MRHLIVNRGAWVLVGDGRKALFLVNHGDSDLLDLRVLVVQQDVNLPIREQRTDEPGRTFPSVGLGGYGSIENTDWHELAKEHLGA